MRGLRLLRPAGGRRRIGLNLCAANSPPPPAIAACRSDGKGLYKGNGPRALGCHGPAHSPTDHGHKFVDIRVGFSRKPRPARVMATVLMNWAAGVSPFCFTSKKHRQFAVNQGCSCQQWGRAAVKSYGDVQVHMDRMCGCAFARKIGIWQSKLPLAPHPTPSRRRHVHAARPWRAPSHVPHRPVSRLVPAHEHWHWRWASAC